MSQHVLARYCIWAIFLFLAVLPASSQTPAGTVATRNYTVFLRGTPVGRESLTVRSDPSGLTISSQSNLGAPLNVVMRKGEVTYRPDLTPASLTLEATINQKEVTLRTTFASSRAGLGRHSSSTASA